MEPNWSTVFSDTGLVCCGLHFVDSGYPEGLLSGVGDRGKTLTETGTERLEAGTRILDCS